MAASESIIGGRSNVADLLKPFYQRASEVEDQLSKLESAFASEKDARNEELLKIINELQENLEGANADLASAREKVAKLALENAKMQYRIHHLVQAFRQENMPSWSI